MRTCRRWTRNSRSGARTRGWWRSVKSAWIILCPRSHKAPSASGRSTSTASSLLARKHGLPVILHVRRSADKLLKHLRDLAPEGGWHGIGHAFNGSAQQAEEFLKLGFKLGFGGAVTFEPALQLRRLATELPLEALVMETDSPDIPPHWIYTTAAEREAGTPQGRNEPGELPRIAQQVAELRGISVDALAAATTANARQALPKLGALLA